MNTYESEFKKLVEIYLNNKKTISSKYDMHKVVGLDGSPDAKEQREESKRFWREVDKLKEKYNIISK